MAIPVPMQERVYTTTTKKGFGSSGAPPLIAYSHLNTANEYKLLTKWTPEIQVPDSWQ